jgi:AcrR family transcriptional regulator
MGTRSRSREKSAALRRHVIETALSLFGRHGYDAVSVEMICDTAEVSVGSLYHHFDSKGGVAAAIYAEAIRRYHEPLLAVVRQNPGAEDGVRSLVEAHHEWAAEHVGWARFMMSSGDLAEIRAKAVEHEVANARLTAALISWARPHMDNGDMVMLDPPVFVSVVFGPSYFHTRMSLSLSPRPPDREVAIHFAAAAWRSLRSPAAQPAE